MCHYFLWGLSSCISVSVWILVRLKPQTPDESVIMHSVSVVNFTVILSPLFFFAAMLLFDSLTGCDKRSGTRHVVVSRYSSSSVSRSQQQSVSHSVGGGGEKSVWFTWGRKEEREEEETSDGEKDIYDSDSGEGELHPNVCSFTAWLNNSQESRYMPARTFAGIAGVKVSRSVCVWAL